MALSPELLLVRQEDRATLWLFLQIWRVLFVGVFLRALLLGVYIRAPDFGKALKEESATTISPHRLVR